MGDFKLEEAAVRETRRRCSRASHRESAEPKGSACCPCACAHSEQQGDHGEEKLKGRKVPLVVEGWTLARVAGDHPNQGCCPLCIVDRESAGAEIG